MAEGQTPKLAILAYNGLELEYPGIGPFVIDLAGMNLGEQIPILADHHNELRSLVGHGTASIQANKLHVNGLANGITEASKAVIGLATAKTPLQASVGVAIHKRQFLNAGDKATVNGRTIKAGKEGLMVVGKSTLQEVSVTPLGVDGQTSVAIAASKGTKPMIETDENLQLAQKQIRDQFLRIDEICSGIELEDEGMQGRLKTLKMSALKGELSTEALLAGIIKLQQDERKLGQITTSRPQGHAIHSSTRDISNDVLECALSLSLNLPKIEEHYEEKTLDQAHSKFRTLGLQEVIDLAAKANGYIGRGCKSDLRGALRYAFAEQLTLSGGPSNVSLPNILGAVANKELLAGYTEEDQTWTEVATVKPVSNFHTHTSYRLLSDFTYQLMTPNGGFPEGRLDEDQVYTRSVDTYGIRFELTRKHITNDDLGAFNDLRTIIGRGGAKAFNNLFWQTFLTNLSSTFTTGNGNYITGTGSALGTDGAALEAAILKFWQMKTPSPEDGGKRIGGQPVKLIIPPELSFNADRLYVSTNLVGGSTLSPEANIHVNRYRPVVVPFLSDNTFTGYSTTGWGLFRDVTQLACMVVSFLNGQQTPTVESTDADFDALGIRFRAFHDFGADPAEILAGVWNKGAA